MDTLALIKLDYNNMRFIVKDMIDACNKRNNKKEEHIEKDMLKNNIDILQKENDDCIKEGIKLRK